MIQCQFVSRRSGVIASVMQRNRSAQTPVSLVRSLSGFTLRFPVSAAQVSQATGPSAARKTSGLTRRTARRDMRGIADCQLLIADLLVRSELGLSENQQSAISSQQ